MREMNHLSQVASCSIKKVPLSLYSNIIAPWSLFPQLQHNEWDTFSEETLAMVGLIISPLL